MTEENIIDVVYQRIVFDQEKLLSRDLEIIKVDTFNLDEFWTRFGSAVQDLSNQVTKIGFMCGKKPLPNNEEISGMLKALMQYYNVMHDLFLVFPEEMGKLVYSSTSDAVVNIMRSLLAVVKSLKDLTENGAKERLTLMGSFWDACNAVNKLSRNNLEASLQAVNTELALIKDAQDELNQLIEDNGVDTSGLSDSFEPWIETEQQLASKATSLLRATELCLDKLSKALKSFGSCDSRENVKQLDHIAHVVRTISPALDDFVCDLSHPIDFPSTLDNAHELVATLHNLLSTVKGCHYEQGLPNSAINILMQLVDSSHEDLKKTCSNPIPELNNLTL